MLMKTRFQPLTFLPRRRVMRRRMFRRAMFPRRFRPLLWVGLVLAGLLIVTRFAARADGLAQQDTPTRPEPAYVDLAYADLSEDNVLDLYLPEGFEPPYPVIIFIHGGGWRTGDKDNPPAAWMTLTGYAVASLNYRLSDEAPFPAQIYDVKAALRWLRANADTYGLDPDHFGVWGSSAGGHLVSLLGTSGGVEDLEDLSMGNAEFSSEVQAVVDWFGPIVLEVEQGGILRGVLRDRDVEGPYASFLDCETDAECEATAAIASPLSYIDETDPPFLIQHGSEDPKVDVEESQLFYDALTEAGVDATLTIFDGAGHGGRAFINRNNLSVIAEFFDAHLRGE